MNDRMWGRDPREIVRRQGGTNLDGPPSGRRRRNRYAWPVVGNLQWGIIIILALMLVFAAIPMISGTSIGQAIQTLVNAGYTVLSADEASEFVKRLGRAGGQLVTGGTGPDEDLDFRTTSNAVKGNYIFGELNCSAFAEGGKLTVGVTGSLTCANDITTAISGAGVVALDFGDNGVNESAALNEIAIVGDTNGCFTEPAPDKLLVTVSCDFPKADLADAATALAANPTDCIATNFANAIVASGNLTCAQVNFTDLGGSATDGQVPNNITVDLATAAGVLSADPLDCGADTKADSIVASGNLTCSGVDTGDITNSTILEEDLSAIDAAGDEECLTSEGTGFEWQSCGAGGSNSFETMNVPSGTDPVADSSTDTLGLVASGTISVTGSAVDDALQWNLTSPTCTDTSGQHLNFNGAVLTCGVTTGNAPTATALAADPGDCGADTKADSINASGTLTCSGVDTGDITNGTILEEDISAVDAAGDEECLTSEGTGFEWQSCSAGGGYATVDDEGVPLTQRTTINFTGVGVTCVDDAGGAETDCDIPGGGSTNSFETWNAGTGTDPVADASNDTMTLSDSATISVTGSAALDALVWILNAPDCNSDNNDRLQYDLTNGTLSCRSGTLGTDDVAGLVVANDTDLLGDRSLTLSATGVMTADPELYTIKKSINILNPTTGESNKIAFEYPLPATITEVSCSVDTGTVTIQFDERVRSTPNTAGTNVLTSSLICDTDTESSNTFSNAVIAGDVPVNLQITATSGSPTIVRIHVESTQDD